MEEKDSNMSGARRWNIVTLWTHPDRKQFYKQLVNEPGKFQICQVNGSLSSIKTWDSVEQAMAEGWAVWDGVIR